MARIVESLAITNPLSDPAIAVDGTFTFEITVTMSGSGESFFDLSFEYDNGTNQVSWYVIPVSGGGLACPAPNPIFYITEDSDSIVRSKTITGKRIDTYYIRGCTNDWNNQSAQKYTDNQLVTVSEGGATNSLARDPAARLRVERPQ